MNLKKIFLIILLLLLCVSALSACKDDDAPKEDVYYTVTFDYNGGGENKIVKVREKSKLMKPDDPEREDWIFIGWESELDGVVYDWDFESDIVVKDITVKAKWINASSVFKYSKNTDGTITITSYSAALSNLQVPSVMSGMKVTGIGDSVFEGIDSEKMQSITLPETVTSIGNSSFAGCSGVQINVKGVIMSVGENAFLDCDGLSEIVLGEKLEVISYRAFANCTALSDISIPSSVTVISENAFEGCTSAKTLLLRSKNVVIEDSAFIDCSLVTVFFLGNSKEFETISINEQGNEAFENARCWFYSSTEPTGDGDYWYFDSNQKPRCWVK